MLGTIGPVWDGNEVWLVVAGAATFAAFPAWYGTMFSGFYVALMLALVFLIVRVVSFEWRSKSESGRWRTVWTWRNTVGSFGIALVWGIGLSNLVSGVPIDSDGNFTGSLIDLFSPYTVFAGITVVVVVRVPRRDVPDPASGGRATRSRRARRPPALRPGRPCGRGVPRLDGGGRDRPQRQGPVPAGAPRGRSGSERSCSRPCLLRSGSNARAFAMTGLGTIALVATLFTSLYPRVMVSNPDSGNSLTVDGAASSGLLAQGDERGRAHLRPARPSLPGVLLLRVPQKASAVSRRRRVPAPMQSALPHQSRRSRSRHTEGVRVTTERDPARDRACPRPGGRIAATSATPEHTRDRGSAPGRIHRRDRDRRVGQARRPAREPLPALRLPRGRHHPVRSRPEAVVRRDGARCAQGGHAARRRGRRRDRRRRRGDGWRCSWPA